MPDPREKTLPPQYHLVLLDIFPMSTWWQVPCTRLSPEKEKKILRDKARALAQGSTCKVSETKCLFETIHLHGRFSHQHVSTLARYQPWWCGSAECVSRALVWLQSCLFPCSRLVLLSFLSLFRASPLLLVTWKSNGESVPGCV